MNKYTILLFLTNSVQGAASGLPSTTFPKFTTQVAPGSGDKTSGFIKAAYAGSSILYGLRNDLYVFPTQLLAAPATPQGTTSDVVQVKAQTATRSFYATSTALHGSYPSAGLETSYSTTMNAKYVEGSYWVICESADIPSVDKCPFGGAAQFSKAPSATAAVAVKNRLYHKVDNPTTAADFITSTKPEVAQKFNSDFIIGSIYQSDGDTQGTNWCNGFYTKLKKTGDVETKKAMQGFGAKTKCTFQLVSEDATVGPSFKITKMDTRDFFINWIEWLKSSSLGTNAKLPDDDTTSLYKIGKYKVDEAKTPGMVYINPITVNAPTVSPTFTGNADAIKWTDNNPGKQVPGNRGNVYYYPGKTGVYKESMYVDFPSWIVDDVYYQLKKGTNDYNKMKDDFNSKAGTYNKAAKGETARLADFFKVSFEPKIAVPVRPCPPTKPMAWSGYILDYGRYIGSGSKSFESDFTKQGKYLGIENRADPTTPTATSDDKFHLRTGYMQASADTSKTDAVSVAHLFGYFGQGEATDGVEKDNKPFRWAAEASGELGTIQVTLISNDSGVTDLAADKVIELKARATKYASYDDFKAPGMPDDPMKLEKDPFASNAMATAASSVLAASVLAMSLY